MVPAKPAAPVTQTTKKPSPSTKQPTAAPQAKPANTASSTQPIAGAPQTATAQQPQSALKPAVAKPLKSAQPGMPTAKKEAQALQTKTPSDPVLDSPENITLPDGKPYKPFGPAKEGAAPESLNPDPNPLQFPTDPEEVRLRGIQPITLNQAIELAERNNRTLQVSQLQLQRSRAALRQAQAALYPTLDLQTGLTNSQSASSELSGQSQSFLNENDDARTSLSGGLSLNYDLFTSGQRPAQIRAAEQQLRSDELALEVAQEQLRLDVANDYYNLQEADETVRISLAAVRNNETSLRDAQALEQAGLGTRFDVLRAEVQLANSQQDLTNAIAQQTVQRRQLAQRLSVPQGINLAAADTIALAGTWGLTLEESIVLAYKNRAELEQQLAQRELSEQQRRAALAALGPQISLSAQYDLLNQFDDDLGTADGYSLAANLRWSIFDGGAARSAAAQQEVNRQIAETRFADVRNQVRFEVEQAYANLVSNQRNIETTRLALAQAEEALRLARLRFQAGVGTQTDVINAETDLTRARSNRLTAILNYNRALAALRRATTNITPTTGKPTGTASPAGTTTPSGTTPATPASPPATEPTDTVTPAPNVPNLAPTIEPAPGATETPPATASPAEPNSAPATQPSP
ncbi:MAG TPA: TolC family protein [Leptolyngbyaceae cyanobacterium M33_DOE_097]|nr:TolC family protein [Leptolyngbyaceae cyanobacterium M33_DOE_097]